MSKYQRTKGHNFERETAKDLGLALGVAVKRNIGQARDGGDDITIPPFRIECKIRAKIAVYKWMEQVQAALKENQIPVIILRADQQKPLVLIEYDTFKKFLKDYLDATNNNQTQSG